MQSIGISLGLLLTFKSCSYYTNSDIGSWDLNHGHKIFKGGKIVANALSQDFELLWTFGLGPGIQAHQFLTEFEGVNEQGNTLDEIHDAYLVLRENIRNKRVLRENLTRFVWFVNINIFVLLMI